MEIVSAGPLPAASLIWQPRPGAWVLTVVAKATYLLRPGELALAPSQESPAAEDRYAGDDPARALLRPRDLVPAKPLADVLLIGSAFAPDRRPARSLVVRLNVGEIDKRLEVVADRWLHGNGAVSEGAPFAQMPLGWERSAGGAANPVGIAAGVADAEGRKLLPNLQRAGASAGSFESVGFGPISPSWPARRSRLGGGEATFSIHDLAARPLPEGMDLGYFNAAPADQQVRTLGASETIVLEHLHPEHARLVTRLPGHVARATFEGRRSGAVTIAMRADTLLIDTDRALVTLTFRGMLPLESADEPGRVTVTMATSGSEPSGVVRAPEIASPLPQVMRAPRALQATADIPLSARQAAVLPFQQRPPEAREAPVSAAPAPESASLATPRPAPVSSPWASGAPRIVEAPAPFDPLPSPAPRAPSPSALDASNAAAGAEPLRVIAKAPRATPDLDATPAPALRAEAREALELLWFDLESVPRFRRRPAWRAILDAAESEPRDPDFDDPAMAKDPMLIEDRREVFEILARGEPADLASLEAQLAACQRDDGKLVPAIALFAGELEMPFDELSALRATIGTVTPLVGADEALKASIESAKELLALPDLMAAPAVAEALTRRIEQAFAGGKRAVSADYLETQRERVLLEQRRYQRRSVFGDKHLRAALRAEGEAPSKPPPGKPGGNVVIAYLPEGLAPLLPLSPRFRARFIAEIRLSADPAEAHPAALRVLAIARAVPTLKR